MSEPAGRLFDSHLHIIDPAFPLVENHGFLPEPFRCADYRASIGPLPVTGGAVVSGSFQAFDQSYLAAALRTLGPGFVGVTQLPPTVRTTRSARSTPRVCARSGSTWCAERPSGRRTSNS